MWKTAEVDIRDWHWSSPDPHPHPPHEHTHTCTLVYTHTDTCTKFTHTMHISYAHIQNTIKEQHSYLLTSAQQHCIERSAAELCKNSKRMTADSSHEGHSSLLHSFPLCHWEEQLGQHKGEKVAQPEAIHIHGEEANVYTAFPGGQGLWGVLPLVLPITQVASNITPTSPAKTRGQAIRSAQQVGGGAAVGWVGHCGSLAFLC